MDHQSHLVKSSKSFTRQIVNFKWFQRFVGGYDNFLNFFRYFPLKISMARAAQKRSLGFVTWSRWKLSVTKSGNLSFVSKSWGSCIPLKIKKFPRKKRKHNLAEETPFIGKTSILLKDFSLCSNIFRSLKDFLSS